MPTPAELELLDNLEGGPEPYMPLEKHVFGGNRDHTLRSVRLMYVEQLIAVVVDDRPVEVWRLEQWRREPDETSTAAAGNNEDFEESL